MNSPAPAPPKPLPGWVVWIFFVGCFAAGAAIVYASVVELTHDRALGEGAVTVTARVVDTRIMTSSKRGDSYEVRYAFEVGGATYTYRDATGRDDLWAPIEQNAFVAARSTGTTEVVYLPSDPWTNQAVHRATSAWGDHLAGLCVGIFCMAPLLLAGLGALRKRPATA